VSVATLRPYLKGDIQCPAGRVEYPPFVVLQGPICPNGHQFAAGDPRPLCASPGDVKLAGLYRAFGFTNLVEKADSASISNSDPSSLNK
jgi:hypothetical protein